MPFSSQISSTLNGITQQYSGSPVSTVTTEIDKGEMLMRTIVRTVAVLMILALVSLIIYKNV